MTTAKKTSKNTTSKTAEKKKVNAPSFDWLRERAAGVLLHPTSLPGPYGIGTLGDEARKLLDFMSEAGLAYWQVCPLGPTGFGDSPYQCFSAFAGNPYLIDLRPLKEAGLLTSDDLSALAELPEDHVEFGDLWKTKWPVLRTAYKRFKELGKDSVCGYDSFEAFKKEHADWLDAYAYFIALKDHHDGAIWTTWEPKLRNYEKAQSHKLKTELADKIEAQKFYQWLFAEQWKLIRAYANDKGIAVVGDMPIFVSLDSADIWTFPKIFKIKANGEPKAVAGVPPDYFSETGQLWGNPLYDWKVLEETGFDWWLKRFKLNFALFDVVRLDHFRGFYDYWQIPADAKDARSGKWMKGPQYAFFEAVKKSFPDAKIIAEDLGDKLDKVFKFRDELKLPGMAILQFAFDGTDKNPYHPKNLKPNTVIYPGTHDNNTTRGWYEEEASENQKHDVRTDLEIAGYEIAYDLIRSAYESPCRLAIVMMQDFMDLGTEARLNTPGTAMGNWQWRYTDTMLERLRPDTTSYLKNLALDHKRKAKAL